MRRGGQRLRGTQSCVPPFCFCWSADVCVSCREANVWRNSSLLAAAPARSHVCRSNRWPWSWVARKLVIKYFNYDWFGNLRFIKRRLKSFVIEMEICLLSPTYFKSANIRAASDARTDEALRLEQVAAEPPIREPYRTRLKLVFMSWQFFHKVTFSGWWKISAKVASSRLCGALLEFVSREMTPIKT